MEEGYGETRGVIAGGVAAGEEGAGEEDTAGWGTEGRRVD